MNLSSLVANKKKIINFDNREATKASFILKIIYKSFISSQSANLLEQEDLDSFS